MGIRGYPKHVGASRRASDHSLLLCWPSPQRHRHTSISHAPSLPVQTPAHSQAKAYRLRSGRVYPKHECQVLLFCWPPPQWHLHQLLTFDTNPLLCHAQPKEVSISVWYVGHLSQKHVLQSAVCISAGLLCSSIYMCVLILSLPGIMTDKESRYLHPGLCRTAIKAEHCPDEYLYLSGMHASSSCALTYQKDHPDPKHQLS